MHVWLVDVGHMVVLEHTPSLLCPHTFFTSSSLHITFSNFLCVCYHIQCTDCIMSVCGIAMYYDDDPIIMMMIVKRESMGQVSFDRICDCFSTLKFSGQ